MNVAQFVNGIRATYGLRYGMGSSDYQRWIDIYGAPTLKQADAYAATMAAVTKASSLYNQLGSWDLVAFAWSSGLNKAVEIEERFGGNIRAAAMEDSRFRTGQATVGKIMGNVQSASTQMPGYTPQSVAPTTVVHYSIPKAPAYDAQAQVDAYVKAMTEQGQAEDDAIADTKMQSGRVVTGVMQTLSNMVKSGGGASVAASPSQQLEPSEVESQIEEVPGG